jgi:hypothetical protein
MTKKIEGNINIDCYKKATQIIAFKWSLYMGNFFSWCSQMNFQNLSWIQIYKC